MNRIAISLLAGISALGFVSSVSAADLIVEAPYVAPGIVDVGGEWDGAFIGVFGGYGWATADHVGSEADPDSLAGSPFLPDGGDVDAAGWLLGVNAGVNFTVSSGIVVGVVGDLAWSNISGSETYPGLGGTEFTYDINWQGSVRGRVGFDGGAFLPYMTAGLAFANATHTNDIGPGASADATHVGWTIGAGVEFAVAENMSLDLQYRYSDLGEQIYDVGAGGTNPNIALTTQAVTLGLNWGF